MPIYPIPPNVTPGGLILSTDVSTLYNAINGGLDFQNIVAGGLKSSNFPANEIGVGVLKTAGATVGVQQPVGKHFGGVYITLTGGAFTFYPGIFADVAGTIAGLGANVTLDTDPDFTLANPALSRTTAIVATSDIWLAVLNTINTGTNSAFTTYKYLSASPPYDLGDGEIPIFIFVLIDGAGNVLATSVAQDPPWMKSPELKPLLPHTLAEAVGDSGKMSALMTALDAFIGNAGELTSLKKLRESASADMKASIDIQMANLYPRMFNTAPQTQQAKNELIDNIPHPFMRNDLVALGASVVMLDPYSQNAKRLAYLHSFGENINKLIHDGIVSISNDLATVTKSPIGVNIVKHSM